ncbi:MAG TPA: DUF222 domain-containing protein, partial [Actinomycetes bacterium]|nr:DUF222 domain-containing protein [Actinomycetes bacterium]
MFELAGHPAPTAAEVRARADAAVTQFLQVGPNAESVTTLCSVSSSHLSAAGRLEYIAAWEQVVAWASSQPLQAIVDHVGPEADCGSRGDHPAGDLATIEQSALVEEIRLALALSPVATKARIEFARELCGPLQRTHQELSAGRITPAHARAMVELVQPLTDADAAVAEARALNKSGWATPGEFRKAVRATVDAIDPEATVSRHLTAKEGRKVRKWQLPDGMACLNVEAPAPDIDTIHAALTVLAGATEADDPRTLDARRTDALLGLCLGAVAPDPDVGSNRIIARPKIPVQAHVVIDLPTLLGLADNPCRLSGYGSIPAGLAREWLQDATTWRRLVVDPIEGHLLDFGPVVRSAPPRLRSYLVERHRTCTFPRCNRKAGATDLDHEPPYQSDGTGGHTSADDLRPLCRHHHNLKTFQHWTVVHDDNGGTTWSS